MILSEFGGQLGALLYRVFLLGLVHDESLLQNLWFWIVHRPQKVGRARKIIHFNLSYEHLFVYMLKCARILCIHLIAIRDDALKLIVRVDCILLNLWYGVLGVLMRLESRFVHPALLAWVNYWVKLNGLVIIEAGSHRYLRVCHVSVVPAPTIWWLELTRYSVHDIR